MQNCAKTSFFYAHKTLVLLKKNAQNRRFNLWTCAVSGRVWKHPGCVFMKFDEGPDDCWLILFVTFHPFRPFPSHFWPYLDYTGWFRTIFWTKIGPFWCHSGGDFGPFLGRSGVTLGWLRDHFGIVLASFLSSFRHRFELLSGPFWCVCDAYGRFLGDF